MKLTTILVFAGMMQIHAAVYSQSTFNINERSTTVREVLKKIEKNSSYTLFYRLDQIDLNRKVSVFAENGSVESVMKQVLQNQPLTFELVDNMIVIKSVNDQSASKDYTISGTITDEKGEPLIGASVGVKGTTRAASTDVNGKFTIRVAGDQPVILVVKYIGFKSQEYNASPGQTSITIKLAADAATLNEVVVIGYGTVKKRDLTGSVASVKAEDIVRTPTHNALEAIQGRAPGVDITRSSGSAGSGVNIAIRGNRSINGSNGPLYIIDGVQGGNIATLNPNDIESIDVLKDASSTAIYGAQGANGVIIVTTKKGTAGKTTVSYNAYYGINGYTSYPEVRTGEDYLNLRREAYRANGEWASPSDDVKIFNAPGEYDAIQNNQWVNWIDLVTQNGSQQNHSLSVRSGTEKTNVFFSAGYFREEGQLRNNDYNRYNVRINLDQKLYKWAKTGLLSQITYSKQNNRRDPLGTALSASPLGTPYDEFGQINVYPITGNTNTVSPLTDERENAAVDQVSNTNINATAYIELTPFKYLTFRSNLGTVLDGNRRGIYNDAKSLAQNSVGYSAASMANNNSRYYNWDNILTYNRTFLKDHSVTATAITSYIHSDEDATNASGIKQLLSSQLFYNLAATEGTTRSISSSFTKWENMAYAGRLNYGYKGKYLLTFTGRFDGASRLSAGHKWDFFPSAAAAWNVTEESFMKDISQISNLKLRASHGVTGNYGITVYGTQSGVIPSQTIGFGNTQLTQYQFNPTIANANLAWEKSATTDVGVDLGVLRNRINLTFDWYNTKTTGILLLRGLPQSTGVANVFQNVGETVNKGIELGLNTKNIDTKDFSWNSVLSFSHNHEEITNLINDRDILATQNTEDESLLLHHPIKSFYTYRKLGIWQTEEAAEAAKYKFGTTAFKPGDIKLEDLNGDFVIDANDRAYIGSTVPKWTAGFQNTIRYKWFDLGVYLVARYGQSIKAEFLGRYNPSGTGNGPSMINYWTPENPTNDFPRPRKDASIITYNGYQSLYYVDGSYLKLKNVSLGYTVPKALISKLNISNLRVYATGSNIFTAAKSHLIKNYDPERGGAESAPLSKQFVFGVNFDF